MQPRVIGTYGGHREGPTVVVIGALHGNEPAGARAARAVLDQLERASIPFRGKMVAVVGNRRALSRQRRYVDRDLNRRWIDERLAETRRVDLNALTDEDREQRELLDVFEPLMREAREPVVFLDLHSMSGRGAPFVCMADVIRNRKIAFALNIPIVLGLEEIIEGSMLGYLCDLGHIGVAVEGGQHNDSATQRNHEATVWTVLVASGAVRAEDVPGYDRLMRALADAVRGLPQVIEIRHRHVCVDGDGFEMRPGYENFQRVLAQEPVAFDHNGDIYTPEAGLMMLPRYQGQGEDGYFIARPVRRFWLTLSAQLRRRRADRILRGLPGVTVHPTRPDHYLVDPRIARFQPTEIFHLLGYRRCRPEGGSLVFSRRRPDDRGPEPLPSIAGRADSPSGP